MQTDSARAVRLSIVDTGRRRRFSAEEKLRIVEESFSRPRFASATARRHAITPSLLFLWRRQALQGRLGVADGFAAAMVLQDASSEIAPTARPEATLGAMEIVTQGARVIVDKGVDADALARVMAVLTQLR